MTAIKYEDWAEWAIDHDPAFREMVLRQRREATALSARHSQEYVRMLLIIRRRHEVEPGGGWPE